MFEHERTDIDEPIEFDFFDDSPTVEVVRDREEPRTRRVRARPAGGGGGGRRGGLDPVLVRRAAAIAGAIVLAVVIVLWVNQCQGARAGEYEAYMSEVNGVAGDSAQIGTELNELVFSTGIQLEDLQAGLEGLRESQGQVLRRAEELDAPGPLREQQQSLVEAFQLRVHGLNGLAQAFGQISDAEAAEQAGPILAEQSDRLIASDVIYEDFFQTRAQEVMGEQGVTGVAVPDSKFVTNIEFANPASWTLVVERLTRPPATGGLRGNAIAGVRALPEGTRLAPQPEENTVRASSELAFEVSVENSGESQETQVRVSLAIQQSPEPIRMEDTIQSINPGDTKTVVFGDLDLVQFATRTIVKVTVEPVEGETNTANNTAEFIVFFTVS